MKNYVKELNKVFLEIEATDDKGKVVILDKAIEKVVSLILAQKKTGNKVIVIGNGGSASIASHTAIDLLKNAKVPAIAFNDSSLLTCLSNDLGYEFVFQKPIEMLSGKGDILFSISSSGKSKNIVNAALEAKQRGCFVITMSGFDRRNPLRKLGRINFYVPSGSYGHVELAHAAICHCVTDRIIEKNNLNG